MENYIMKCVTLGTFIICVGLSYMIGQAHSQIAKLENDLVLWKKKETIRNGKNVK